MDVFVVVAFLLAIYVVWYREEGLVIYSLRLKVGRNSVLADTTYKCIIGKAG
jgi:hypothetical protein